MKTQPLLAVFIFALHHAYRLYRTWRWALWGGLLAYVLSACSTDGASVSAVPSQQLRAVSAQTAKSLPPVSAGPVSTSSRLAWVADGGQPLHPQWATYVAAGRHCRLGWPPLLFHA